MAVVKSSEFPVDSSCPKCGAISKLKLSMIGKRVRCGRCKEPYEVEAPLQVTKPQEQGPGLGYAAFGFGLASILLCSRAMKHCNAAGAHYGQVGRTLGIAGVGFSLVVFAGLGLLALMSD